MFGEPPEQVVKLSVVTTLLPEGTSIIPAAHPACQPEDSRPPAGFFASRRPPPRFRGNSPHNPRVPEEGLEPSRP